MYMGYSRPNSEATFSKAASMALLFSGWEKSTNGSFVNSETCNFASAVAMAEISPRDANKPLYCARKVTDKQRPARGGTCRHCASLLLVQGILCGIGFRLGRLHVALQLRRSRRHLKGHVVAGGHQRRRFGLQETDFPSPRIKFNSRSHGQSRDLFFILRFQTGGGLDQFRLQENV